MSHFMQRRGERSPSLVRHTATDRLLGHGVRPSAYQPTEASHASPAAGSTSKED